MPGGWAGLAAGVASAAGSIGSSLAQSGSAGNAAGLQLSMFNQEQGNLTPFINYGGTAAGTIQNLISSGFLTANPAMGSGFNIGQATSGPGAFSFNPNQISQNPGYQWQLGQGTQAVMNNISQLGGVGGNALQALTGYGQGLAAQYEPQFFNQALQGWQANVNQTAQYQQQVYNMLTGQAQLGENAAVNMGNTGAQIANNAGNFLTQQGNAQAAGIAGATNALTGGLNNYSNQQMYQQLANTYLNQAGYAPPGQADTGGTA
jgi:hypothetical protein